MNKVRRRGGALLAIALVSGLMLSGCGAGTPEPLSGTTSNVQGEPMRNSEAPGGLDSPVSGQPGQPGGAVVNNGVHGQVTDAAGQPLADVVIAPQSTDTPPQPVPELAVYSDAQGRFQWVLSPGSYTLTFVREGYAPLTKALVVAAGQQTTLDVMLQKLP